MLTDEETAFLHARLDQDEETATRAAKCDKLAREGAERGLAPGDWSWLAHYGQPQPGDIALIDHQVRFDPAHELREIEVWRRILLEYAIPPGTDAVYGGTERETGFRLALSFALKAKAATYGDHPDYAAPSGLAGSEAGQP